MEVSNSHDDSKLVGDVPLSQYSNIPIYVCQC